MTHSSTPASTPTPDVGQSSVAQSSDAQLFLLVEIGKVLSVRNTLYETLLKFANTVMQGQISAGYSGASSLSTSAETSFWTQAVGHGLQIGVNGYGATAGVRGYKAVEDKFNGGTDGIKSLKTQLDDIDSEFTARENNGNGAVRVAQDQPEELALEARRAAPAEGEAAPGDNVQRTEAANTQVARNSDLKNVSHSELERRKKRLKRNFKSKKDELEKALEQHKGKLDRYTQISMAVSGLAKSSGETISQNGQASAQASNTTNSISKDAEQYLNSAAQGQEQTGNSFAQAAGQAMAASQATAGR